MLGRFVGMRFHVLARTVCTLLLVSAGALADDDIGTTPAAAPLVKGEATVSPRSGSYDEPDRVYHGPDAPIAKDPPKDWAVLYAGLRPHLGTFGGIATLAVAHARTERFYGGFSFSLIRNDAGTHVSIAQLALGRNLSDSFAGGLQWSLTENRARHFAGIAQTSLAYNRAGKFGGEFQLACFNRATSITGLAQLGGYNRDDERFTGLAQLGAFNHAKEDFTGFAQLGVLNATGDEVFDDNKSAGRFAGITQVGVVNYVGNDFRGFAQIGGGNFVTGDFAGGFQIGALTASANKFRGIAQIGGYVHSEESYGAQIGVVNRVKDEHTGIQIGVVNMADEVTGVQIGLFNHARRLRGLQIGIANHAEDGVLPWTTILNMGFGDGDGGETDDYSSRPLAAKRQGTSVSF